MANRLVSVGDDFNLPGAVNVLDENLPANLQPAALSATYVPKDSVYLTDYLTAGATTAANRTAYQAAIDEADATGKPLCYDGAFFTISGDAVRSASDGAIHWASGKDTHKVVQETKGKGVLRIAGTNARADRLYFDGNNPTMDLNGALPAQTFWLSFGIWLEPTAHGFIGRNLKFGGLMRGLAGSPIQPEQMDANPNLAGLAQLNGVDVDGIESDGCWTAFQVLGTRKIRVRNVTGTYKPCIGSGAAPHLVYVNGPLDDGTNQVWNEDLDLADSFSYGGAGGHAFKVRGTKRVTLSNLRATDTSGLFDLSISEDIRLGEGCVSSRDTITDESGSVSLLLLTRGHIAPVHVSLASSAASGVGLRVDQCSDLTVNRPVVIASNGMVARPLLTVRGPNPRCRIIEPVLTNLGASVDQAINVLESSGLSNSVSQAEIIHPYITGTYVRGVRISLSGSVLHHDASTNSGTRKILLDTARTVKVVNRAAPARFDLDPNILGWHTGEHMDTNASNRWPDGHTMTYQLGSWVGNENGRLTCDTGGGRMMVATFEADVDARVDVLLSSASYAGIALKAVSASSFIAVVRAPGALKIVKVVGSNTVTDLASVATTFPNGARAELRAVVVGNTIVGYLNGTVAVQHTLTGGDETTFTSAVHGLYGANASTSAWDFLRLRKVN